MTLKDNDGNAKTCIFSGVVALPPKLLPFPIRLWLGSLRLREEGDMFSGGGGEGGEGRRGQRRSSAAPRWEGAVTNREIERDK